MDCRTENKNIFVEVSNLELSCCCWCCCCCLDSLILSLDASGQKAGADDTNKLQVEDKKTGNQNEVQKIHFKRKC